MLLSKNLEHLTKNIHLMLSCRTWVIAFCFPSVLNYVNSFAADGDRLIMKGANLTIREMLNAFNSRCEAKENMAQEKAQKKSA